MVDFGPPHYISLAAGSSLLGAVIYRLYKESPVPVRNLLLAMVSLPLFAFGTGSKVVVDMQKGRVEVAEVQALKAALAALTEEIRVPDNERKSLATVGGEPDQPVALPAVAKPNTVADVEGAVSQSAIGLGGTRYARMSSGIRLQGDAWRWWSAAKGVYHQEHRPHVDSVLVFKRQIGMPSGQLAVVRAVVGERLIQIDAADWRRKGATASLAALDMSLGNDWTEVKIWEKGKLSEKSYSAEGFISKQEIGPGEDKGVKASPPPRP